MVKPKTVVSEKCPKLRIIHFGEPRFARCVLPWNWTHLFNGYKEHTIEYRQGGLGKLTVSGRFETWACIKGHPCASDLTDNYFCFVWEQVERKWVAWGPNADLNLLQLPVTQDEVVHLREEVKEQSTLLQQQQQQIQQLEDKLKNLELVTHTRGRSATGDHAREKKKKKKKKKLVESWKDTGAEN